MLDIELLFPSTEIETEDQVPEWQRQSELAQILEEARRGIGNECHGMKV